ncbi:hypothetical protein GJ744_003829 [Endocarpon pusillum]|uniref:Uncharacterized protein n=1 Tax=Endocarpon pusillum TaxID=364733 RepID=A0A8H7AR49_9EURO|nr:hypothetical protein GJ744_003829 [Endocarpon pusillum]
MSVSMSFSNERKTSSSRLLLALHSDSSGGLKRPWQAAQRRPTLRSVRAANQWRIASDTMPATFSPIP